MNENIILIDWFTMTSHCDSLQSFIQLLGLEDLKFAELDRGHYGYHNALFFNGIYILYGGREDMGICVEMSGQGCRQFETSSTKTFNDLFDIAIRCKADGYKITRLDVAYDDIDKDGNGLLNIQQICKASYMGRYVSRFSKSHPEVDITLDSDGTVTRAHSCYFGSASSEVRFRFYDKAAERGGLPYHWVRLELQLRRDRAFEFINSSGDIGYKFCGVVNNYLRFIVPEHSDRNRWRWNSPKWWTDFLFHAEKIQLFTKKDIEYNLTRVERYVFEQAGNSVLTYIDCVGLEHFQTELNKRKPYLNVNQRALISEYEQRASAQKKK